MDKVFLELTSRLLEPKVLQSKEVIKKLFPRSDSRYPETTLRRFVSFNEKAFEFLGVNAEVSGSDSDIKLSISTSEYVGAIPIRMPVDGKSYSDLHILPDFMKSNSLVELTKIMSLLDTYIKPEYHEKLTLSQPFQMKPPMFIEAVKFVELLEKYAGKKWQKFSSVTAVHPYPKSGTDWSKYSKTSYDPRKALQFTSRDNILSVDHEEWRQIRYTFDVSKKIIDSTSTPYEIRVKYASVIIRLDRLFSNIEPMPVESIVAHHSDPVHIKMIKEQANVVLSEKSSICFAWRIDIAKLFESYVQYVLEKSVKELSGSLYKNPRLYSKGNIPKWGLRYLEPDIMLSFNGLTIMADAKYKANLFDYSNVSEKLKDSQRADLHQILAYSSFEPQNNKIGLLFYPYNKTKFEKISYFDGISRVENKVYLCGVPFASDAVESTVIDLSAFLRDVVDVSDGEI